MSIEQNTPLAGTEALTLPPALRKLRLRRNEASQYLEVMHGIPLAPSTLSLATLLAITLCQLPRER